MQFRTTVLCSLALLVGLFLGFAALSAQEKSRRSNEIVLIYGVGGVLTADGTLHQYAPDVGSWMTIDEAFQRDGQEVRVLPLPVKPEEIRMMESWGFLVTHSGEVWYYDLAQNQWANVGHP